MLIRSGFGPDQIRFGRDIIGARQSYTPQDSSASLCGRAGVDADRRACRSPACAASGIGPRRGARSLPRARRRRAATAGAGRSIRKSSRGRSQGATRCGIGAGRTAPTRRSAGTLSLDQQCARRAGRLHCSGRSGRRRHAESLRALVDALHDGHIDTLIIIGANPAYDAPGDLAFADAISAAPFSVHLGLYRDETAARCTWHLPLSHPLESWSDIRAVDGTASIIQPLIRPLYDTRTAHQLVAMLSEAIRLSSFDVVRNHWRATTPEPAISRRGGGRHCKTA